MLNSLFSLFLVGAFARGPLICNKGSLRETTNDKTTETKVTYCYNEDRNILTSPHCKKLDCLVAFNAKKRFAKSDISNSTSNPGFNICRELNGKPQIVEFKTGNDWHRLDRCTFKDGNFVSTSELVGFYLKPHRE